ncbi:MAG: IS91 family transposase [Rhodoferax sp.]|uniref:IS91 family transposase n=1 Tax=Rhodoferax sp. TaxID=50421 RepID=UPI0032663508
MATPATLAQVLRQHGTAYLDAHTLSTPQAKAWRAIVACRTKALGGQQLACDACGHSHWQYHSCRNRHCPQCGARAKDAWLQGRLAEVLPVPYTHLVFTLPHSLNALYAFHPRWVINTLFACTSQTLNVFAANPRWMGKEGGVKGGTPAFSLVLHTWTQDLRRHIHVHAVMACGVLGLDGQGRDQWHRPQRKPDFLFPVHALSRVFRGRFLAALGKAHGTPALACDPQAEPTAWAQRQRELYRHDWVVYAKTPLSGPAQTLEYLSRDTHRTAIGNERIKAITPEEEVFTVRSDDQGGKRTVRLPGAEFVRRVLLHTLPAGIQRIRHYGVLASACKADKLAQARRALQMPAPSARAQESAQAFMARVAKLEVMQCPCCKVSVLRVVATVAGCRQLPAPGAIGAAQPRGPP